MARKLKAISPGEVLLEEFLKPLGISQSGLARDLNVPVGRVSDIVQGKRAITPDTALRLAVYFNMTPEFWMNLQSHYDLKLAKQNLLPKIERSVKKVERKAA
ncbi:MAG: HigA family addiction module antitoxin [Pyrinomonadaceae bacterium]